MEKLKSSEVYSLHKYIDSNGAPDRDRIFSRRGPESIFKRHLDPKLKKIWRNQPGEVYEVVDKHLRECRECSDDFKDVEEEAGQMDLPGMMDNG